MRKTLAALLVAVAAPCAFADASVPYTFSPGSPARAADVNANFSALVSAINAVGARVSKLEGQLTPSDLAGTYSIQRFQTELGGGQSAYVAVYTAGGTLTLAADGSGSITSPAETGSQLTLGNFNRSNFVGSGPETSSFTWSYANGVITLPFSGLSVLDGGRLLISVGSNQSDGTSHILLLTRTN